MKNPYPRSRKPFSRNARPSTQRVKKSAPKEQVAPAFPVRLNRYLAEKGIATRRGADELIEKGLVMINGVVAKLGDKVASPEDKVVVSEKVLAKMAHGYRYIAYYKPRGISTDVQSEGESIKSILPPALRGLFPLGRLDKDSEGLVILTNDGRLTDRILSPEHVHEKEYMVKVNKTVSDTFIRHMIRGVMIEGYKTKPAKARRGGETLFRITLTEGKRHQIRRMCAREGYEVTELKRVRVMNIQLGTLKPGEYRDISKEELTKLFTTIGLTQTQL